MVTRNLKGRIRKNREYGDWELVNPWGQFSVHNSQPDALQELCRFWEWL